MSKRFILAGNVAPCGFSLLWVQNLMVNTRSDKSQLLIRARAIGLTVYFVLYVLGNKNGKFAYMEASQRKQGDNVRLLSPKIQGENCLSLMYHMYGGSLGSLIIYLNTSSNETVEWIKSGNHPDQWFEAAVFFNTSVEYQVIFF